MAHNEWGPKAGVANDRKHLTTMLYLGRAVDTNIIIDELHLWYHLVLAVALYHLLLVLPRFGQLSSLSCKVTNIVCLFLGGAMFFLMLFVDCLNKRTY